MLAVTLLGIASHALWPASGTAEWMPGWVPAPAEDAYILYRYSEHLAAGHGIRWNLSEPPVDGATDFLWMLALAAWAAVFGSVIPGNYILGAVFALLAAVLGPALVRRLGLPPAAGWLFAAAVVASPIVYHVVNGYGVPLYALCLGLPLAGSILLAARLEAPSHRLLALWAVSLLLAGLARPEGNIFAGLLVAAAIAGTIRRPRVMRRALIWVVFGYLLPGLLVLIGRQVYFGEVLPAPFFVKALESDWGALALGNLERYGLQVLLPQALLFLPLTRVHDRRLRQSLMLCFAAVVLFFVPYLFFHQTQNDSMRFEYHFFYLGLLTSCTALGAIQLRGRRSARTAAVAVVCAWLVFLAVTRPSAQLRDSRWQVGPLLAEYRRDGLALATTEAGVVPFISGWPTLDSYGLNDYRIGAGGISWERWRELSPALVLNHTPNLVDPELEKAGGNRRQLYELMRRDGRYVPVAAIEVRRWLGRPASGHHLYFLRRDVPEFEELVSRIRSLPGETYHPLPEAFSAYLAPASALETGNGLR